MAQAAREPDALDMWFTRQRRLWWKKWRWVAVSAIALRAVWLLAQFTVLFSAASSSTLVYEPWYRHTLNLLIWDWAYGIHAVLFVGIALVLGALEFKACTPSAEVALTTSYEKAYIALNIYARRRMWFWVGILYTIPVAIDQICDWSAIEHPQLSLAYPGILDSASDTLYIVAFSCFVVEFQSYLLRATTITRQFTFLYLLPCVVWPILDKLYRYACIEIWNANWYYIHGSDLVEGLYESQMRTYTWVETSFSFALLALAIVFSAGKLKPPASFRGTYTD
jgi:hypothetical protein